MGAIGSIPSRLPLPLLKQTSEPADVDGILYSIMHGCVIKGVVEIKTRYMSLDKLMGPYKGEWLITKNKLDRFS